MDVKINTEDNPTIIAFDAKGMPSLLLVNGIKVSKIRSIDLKWDIKEQTAPLVKLGMIAMAKEEPTP